MRNCLRPRYCVPSCTRAATLEFPPPLLPAAYGIVCAAVDTRTNQQVWLQGVAGRRQCSQCACRAAGKGGHGILASSPRAAPPFIAALSDRARAERGSKRRPYGVLQVAIKKIGDIFANPLDARRTLREIQARRRRWTASHSAHTNGGVSRGGRGARGSFPCALYPKGDGRHALATGAVAVACARLGLGLVRPC